MTDFVTWEFLSSFAGLVMATGIITQFIKDKWVFANIPTQLISCVVACIIVLLAGYFTGGLTLSTAVLDILNAVLVSLSSNGTYMAVKSITQKPSSTD